MIDNLKKILNEDQDPKAIEKITTKLDNLLMSNEEVGYIAVQKKPAVTILPDSIVVTNKRIILCKPKNLGLSMEFMDYDWDDIAACFVKEGILGADFTFTTKSELTHTVDYLPKNQARKLYTYSKEQLDLLKNPKNIIQTEDLIPEKNETVEEIQTEEVTNFAEIIPSNNLSFEEPNLEKNVGEKKLSELTQDELFEKLQNYKKLLDNGLILQGEYDNLKKEILSYM
ncbi:PH domain-containing protein [Flavobacterium aciduliphilum]|uniref:PH (Pleckstrin Homology) domain-containing protein n=1 Tax=Flavobacterium aciduliphilum TaxID=1101402 RepID=A0A328YPM4_9FLAO|nr:PH domain-containing protein [Flavobacterium aciduliphilum]RAR72477.1 PH (Pleckstrin Homology) domain-containing protein [Flavobacterium aciduliphilum]